jgi:tyrosyl-tRNA synthetase
VNEAPTAGSSPDPADIARLREEVAAGRNPRDVKFELGMEIVDRFHGAGSGTRARDEFVARFSQGALPEDLAEITLAAETRFVATLRLQHVSAMGGGAQGARLGCEWALAGAAGRMLQCYVDLAQKRRRLVTLR